MLFADLKGSMELLADPDPEEARQLLDPRPERLMAAHRYEGTVNQVMGDGIMALFGAPIAHEDHAVRGCYAALAMQESIRRYSEEVRRAHGFEVQIRVGLNSGEVVARAIGNDLYMDYSAIGQTTHLAARMEQLAPPGTIRLTAETLRLAAGWVQAIPLGLSHLQAAEFLYETRLFPEHEYTFKHALTQQVAYETLLQERRRALHARIVEALEALAGEWVVEQVERLAHHALRGEVWDKALTYCRHAGEKALARSAHREVLVCYEQALVALRISPKAARQSSRPSISASTCAMRSCRLANSGRCSTICARRRPSLRP